MPTSTALMTLPNQESPPTHPPCGISAPSTNLNTSAVWARMGLLLGKLDRTKKLIFHLQQGIHLILIPFAKKLLLLIWPQNSKLSSCYVTYDIVTNKKNTKLHIPCAFTCTSCHHCTKKMKLLGKAAGMHPHCSSVSKMW
jgi:hypothetical protein